MTAGQPAFRPVPVVSSTAAAIAVVPAAALLSTWVSASSGSGRALALLVAGIGLLAVHTAVVRLGRPRLSLQELALTCVLAGGLLASFAVATGLTVLSLNTTLYEQTRPDLALAGAVTASFALLLLGHAVACRRAARRLPRRRRSGDLSP